MYNLPFQIYLKMLKKLLLFLLINNAGFSQVFINELDCDTPSIDVLEFVEFRTVTPNFSLNGYVLIFFNEGTGLSYQSFDLDGMVTDVNGIATLGSIGVSPAPDRNAPDNFIENGPDGLAIYQLNSAPANGKTPAQITALGAVLIDALIYETNDAVAATGLMAALGETISYDEQISVANPSSVNSIQRKDDGTYETKIPTPDVPNDGSGFITNAITATFSTSELTEPNSFSITFSTQTPVLGTNLVLNYTLANGAFTMGDYSGLVTSTIPVGSSNVVVNYTLVDDAINEGDEILKLTIAAVASNYSLTNNNIEIRVHDNDYIVQPWGTPLAPTYGLCPSTKPAGYYDSLEGLSGATLKQAIQDIIANPTVRYQTYGDVWEMLAEADTSPQNDGYVWLMYVEHSSSKLNQQTGTSGAIGFWNREHIYCQSRGDFDNGGANPLDTSSNGINSYTFTSGANDIYAGGSDGHHIRAEDSPENSSRNNRNYGVDYNGPTGNAGSWRGDVARAIFYMAVRYNGLNVVNGNVSETPTGYIGDLATLLTWNVADPADDFEMNHNNVVYTWQQNRNPFVDYPDLANYIWGANTGQVWHLPLSTQDFKELQVAIYPNPAQEYLIISGINDEATVEISSMTGLSAYQGKYKANEKINLNLSAGIYLIKVTENNKSAIKKLIIK